MAEAGRQQGLAEGNLYQTMRAPRGTVAEVQSTNLVKGSPEQLYGEAAIHPIYELLDFVPVVVDGRIIGVAMRPNDLATPLSECMVNMTEDMLISAETCLLQLVHADWKRSPFFLVIQETSICGIITKADVNKLPVRVSIFELLSDYEHALTKRLESTLGKDEDWLSRLDDKQVERLRTQYRQDQANGIDLSLISCVALGIKVQIDWEFLPEFRTFKRSEVDSLTKLRNTISHGKPMITRRFKVENLSKILKLAKDLTTALSN